MRTSLPPAMLVLVLSLGAACTEGVPRDATAAQAIVRGQPTLGDPSVLYLTLDGNDECTGTLITPRVVLTARHCLEDVQTVEAFFGPDINGPGESRQVVHTLMHPQQGNEDFDVALLTLDRPGPSTPIPANTVDPSRLVRSPVRIVGYGVTSENGQVSGVKREGNTVLDAVDATTITTGSSGSNTCYGDSGGPALMTIGGREVVVGVTSYGTSECGRPSDIFARVDYYAAWIANYISVHDPAPGAPDAGVAIDAGSVALDASAPDAQRAADASAPDAPQAADASSPLDAGGGADRPITGEPVDGGAADLGSPGPPLAAPNVTIVVNESSCATTRGAGVDGVLVVLVALGVARRRRARRAVQR